MYLRERFHNSAQTQTQTQLQQESVSKSFLAEKLFTARSCVCEPEMKVKLFFFFPYLCLLTFIKMTFIASLCVNAARQAIAFCSLISPT